MMNASELETCYKWLGILGVKHNVMKEKTIDQYLQQVVKYCLQK